MLDMGLRTNVGNFGILIEDEYKDLMVEEAEGDVKIFDDDEDENEIWDGGVEGEDIQLVTASVGQGGH